MLCLGDVRVGKVREANIPTKLEEEDTIVGVQELEADKTEPVPNFAEAGIQSHSEIVKDLTLGSAAATFHVGKEATRIIMQKRMVIYHSPVVAYLLPKTLSDTLALPNIDPDAFYHIYNMSGCHRTNLTFSQTALALTFSQASETPVPFSVACLPQPATWRSPASSLCSSSSSKQHLRWLALKECALLLPEHGDGEWEFDGGEYVLWKLLLEELCVAFSQKREAGACGV